MTQWKEYTFLNEEVIVSFPSEWYITGEHSVGVTLQRDPVHKLFFSDLTGDGFGIDLKSLRRMKMLVADLPIQEEIRFMSEGSLDISRNNVYFVATRFHREYEIESALLNILMGDNEHQINIQLVIHGPSNVPMAMTNLAKQLAERIRFPASELPVNQALSLRTNSSRSWFGWARRSTT